MKATVSIDTSAFDRFVERLEDKLDPGTAGPLQDGLLGAMDVYFDAERARFGSASMRDGTWQEHAPSTIKKRGEGAPLLNETGQLEESMQRDAAGHVLEMSSEGITEGTADRTARFHQDGAPENNMPARPILASPDSETLQKMQPPLAEGIQNAIREAGH